MGAMSMTFTGQSRSIEQDDAAHRAVLQVKSREAGGQGYANADVTFALSDGGGTIHTAAQITGKAASMGEGIVQTRARRADQRLHLEAGGDLMRDVIAQVDEWVARGDRVALATVVAIRRSAPRQPGSKMAINDRGEVFGAVSGGCVEGAVVAIAQDVLAGGRPQLCSYGIADDEAWSVGLPCGGEIDVWVERYEP